MYALLPPCELITSSFMFSQSIDKSACLESVANFDHAFFFSKINLQPNVWGTFTLCIRITFDIYNGLTCLISIGFALWNLSSLCQSCMIGKLTRWTAWSRLSALTSAFGIVEGLQDQRGTGGPHCDRCVWSVKIGSSPHSPPPNSTIITLFHRLTGTSSSSRAVDTQHQLWFVHWLLLFCMHFDKNRDF